MKEQISKEQISKEQIEAYNIFKSSLNNLTNEQLIGLILLFIGELSLRITGKNPIKLE